MGIQKANIHNLTKPSTRPISVLFNPEEYSLEAGNSLGELAVPQGQPTLQFHSRKLRRLNLDLFFDTLEEGTDVCDQIAPLVNLLERETPRSAPPMLLFSWGTFQFICLLESVGQRFTHFLPSGTPVRAYLKLSFVECPGGGPEVSSGVSAATATVHQTSQGETMSQVAARTTGDPGRWLEIAEANNIDNPRKLEAGRPLVVPSGKPISRPG
jgi:hypothetical protein